MNEVFSNVPPVCPRCGRFAQQRETQFGVRSQCCGLWSWDGKPLADEATHTARKAAHAAFDKLWQGGHMKRKRAYLWLKHNLQTPDIPHMATMDPLQCARVVAVVQSYLASLQ